MCLDNCDDKQNQRTMIMNTSIKGSFFTKATFIKFARKLLKLIIAITLVCAALLLTFSVSKDKMVGSYFFSVAIVPFVAFWAYCLSIDTSRFNLLVSMQSKQTLNTACKLYIVIALPLAFCVTSLVSFDLSELHRKSALGHSPFVNFAVIVLTVFALTAVYDICRACVLCALLKREPVLQYLEKIGNNAEEEYPLIRSGQSSFVTAGVFLSVVTSPQNPATWLIVAVYAAFDIAHSFMSDSVTLVRDEENDEVRQNY